MIDPTGRRVSVIPGDGVVVVDDTARFCAVAAAQGLRALQWTGDEGYAEWQDGPQERFTDPAVIAPALEAWDLAGAE